MTTVEGDHPAPQPAAKPVRRAKTDSPDPEGLERLLQYLYRTHGFDFTCYKRATLARRIQRRIEVLGLGTFADYCDYLEVEPEEFPLLFESILINVTAFFRDPEAWDFVRERAIRPIVDAKASSEEGIRVWSAGCASGEEALTIAMLFCEEMGTDAFKQKVKIYATDIDEAALAAARTAAYTDKDVADIPEALREKYLEQQGSRWTFRNDLRRSVIFGRHDLSRDAAISHLDLLVCRNTLMYFTAESQARILSRLHYALNDDGFLFLGRAEMLLSHTNLFVPLDSGHRLFTKVPREVPQRASATAPDQTETSDNRGREDREMLTDLVFEETAVAAIVIDGTGMLVLANRKARSLFGLSAGDLGKRFQDLELSYRPVELRARVEQAQSSGVPVAVKGVDMERTGSGAPQRLDVLVIPLKAAGKTAGTAIVFQDVSEFHRIEADLLRSNQELETAYEELQSSNEELATTNEELQSMVEELETTNEEFQSANEELETMNEELQSTNGELQTVNFELRERSKELDELSSFMDSVLSSLYFGVIIVDGEGKVQAWNGQAQEMWGLRADEVKDEDLFSLDFGLPVSEFRKPILEAIADPKKPLFETNRSCTNRRGRTIECHVSVAPLTTHEGNASGAIVLTREA